MNLFLVGLSHKTAPIEIREKLDFTADLSHAYLEKLSRFPSIQSGIVLSTCNRVEIYAHGQSQNLDDTLKSFLCEFHHLGHSDVDPYLYLKRNEEAVRHLFSVTSSLDSAVLGEPQISGQVKDAYELSKKFGLIDSFFEHFLQTTFSIAKKIRNDTEIGKLSVSISSLAVELAGKVFETFHDKSALILGSGDMAELVLFHLRRKGIEKVWIANRTFDTAAKLAKEFDGFPLYLEKFVDVLPFADMVFTATGLPQYLIHKEMVEKSLNQRKQTPQLFMDISVPRNIDPTIDELTNAYLYNIDHLQNILQDNQASRMEASKKAFDIIDVETKVFLKELHQKNYSPVIQKLQKKISDLLENEWKKTSSSMSEKEHQAIQRLLQSIQQKLLIEPIRFLKEDDVKKFEEKVKIISEVFGLDRDG